MNNSIRSILSCLAAILLLCPTPAKAAEVADSVVGTAAAKAAEVADGNVGTAADTMAVGTTLLPDSLVSKQMSAAANADTTSAKKKAKRDWATWAPDPKRAMWLAVVLPGAGQIYNRKYWKLPIVYGGFLGCIYAWRWNGQMYKDYSQAYMDIMDDDPSTQSYNQFLHLGVTITDDNLSRYQTLFKKRKDYYRKYRDLSIFCLIGVYALSIIDAYVDASLSQFDISKDLSLRIEPSVINNHSSANPVKSSSLGVQCALNF